MARPRRAGAFIEADVLHHWRTQVAGAAGFGLWAAALSWCDLHLTDGHIPAEAAYRLLPGARAAAVRVTKSGFWTACATHEDCFQLHAYAEDGRGRKRQPTRADIEAERERQKARDARKRTSIPGQFPDSSRREPPGNGAGTPREPQPLDSSSSLVVPPLSPPHGGEPTPRTRRATALPAGWEPNDGHLVFATANGLDLDAEVQKFRDFHLLKGTLGKDWDAGFRTWLRKAVDYRNRDNPQPAQPEPPRKKFTA